MFRDLTMDVVEAGLDTLGWTLVRSNDTAQFAVDRAGVNLIFLVGLRGSGLICFDSFSPVSERLPFAQLLIWCNSWNRDHLSPKLYVVDIEGNPSVAGQYSARISSPFEFPTLVNHIKWAVDRSHDAWADLRKQI